MKDNSLDILKKLGSGFKVPEGYFNTVEEDVFAKLKTRALPKKSGFKAPEGYLESVEDTVLNELEVSTKKEGNFGVPEGYFENFEGSVFERLKAEEKEPKVIKFRERVLKIVIPTAVAASLLLFLFFQYSNNTTESLDWDTLADTEVVNWMNEDLVSFSSYDIAEVFEDVSIEETINSLDIESEDVESYLDGTDVESILLNEEY